MEIFFTFQVVLKDPGHGKPADWWSLGIFFYDLVTGRSPFQSNRGKKAVKENILKGKFTLPKWISNDAMDLLR
jgi:serine/threonine protein kinase